MLLGKQLYITASDTLSDQTFVGVRNSQDMAFIKKPTRGTGLWTSTWREETQDSDWVEWCHGNDFGDPYKKNWLLLTPKDDIKLYMIDSLKDLHRLLRDHGYRDPIMEAVGIMKTTIDFERLSLEYDGIWLTEQGNQETHLSYPEDLNAWDCESILWFRWCFTEVQRIATPKPVMIEE